MADALTVTRGETGQVRVFAINMEDDEPRRLAQEEGPLARALGAEAVDVGGAEVVRVADLQPMKLSAYLTEAMGLEDDEVAEDRGRLDSLGGYVLILRSTAFAKTEQTLTPGPDLRLIGIYAEPKPKPSFEELPDGGAHRTASSAAAETRPVDTGRSRGSWPVGLIVALAVIAVLIVLVVLS